MQNLVKKIDYSKLLGFDLVSDEMADRNSISRMGTSASKARRESWIQNRTTDSYRFACGSRGRQPAHHAGPRGKEDCQHLIP